MKLGQDFVSTTSLPDEIAFRIQMNILEGDYPPGTHLLQDQLCERFGVSRTPVREALRKLQAQHLVVVTPNRGAKVRVLTKKELIEIYSVRAELEAFCCELAAPRLTSEAIAGLESAQSILEEAFRQFERSKVRVKEEASFNTKLAKANEEFHGIIHLTADNHHLRRIIKDLEKFFYKGYVWQAARSTRDEFRELNIKEHKQILRTLMARDAAGARRAMKDHVLHVGAVLTRYLEKQGFWDGKARRVNERPLDLARGQSAQVPSGEDLRSI